MKMMIPLFANNPIASGVRSNLLLYFYLGLTCCLVCYKSFAQAESAKPSTEPLPSVSNVLNAYISALGGKNKLLQVQSRKLVGSLEISDFGLNATAVIEEKPPYFRKMTIQLPGSGRLTEIFTDSHGWTHSPGTGLVVKSKDEIAFHRRINGFYRDLKLDEIYESLEIKGLWNIQGEPCYMLECKTATDVSDLLYFSKITGLLLRQDQSNPSSDGVSKFSVYYDEYLKVEGALYPSKIRVQPPFGGVILFEVENVIPNAPIDVTAFQQPGNVTGSNSNEDSSQSVQPES